MTLELARNRRYGQNVLRDIFADHTIASGGSRNQLTSFVAQINGQAVDLEFAQKATRAGFACPSRKFFGREGVVEAHHALEVFYRRECLIRAAANGLGWAIASNQVGMSRFESLELMKHGVVLGVADKHRIAFVIGTPVVVDLVDQSVDSLLSGGSI